MSRMTKLTTSAAAVCALLCACGGGGGGDDNLTISFGYSVDRKTPIYTWADSGSPVGSTSMAGEHFVITSGSLAPGTSLDASTGQVTGYPTATGIYSAVVQMTVSGYKGSGTATVTQDIVPIVMTPWGLGSFDNASSAIIEIGFLDSEIGVVTQDVPHGVMLDYHLAANSAALPAGMTLDASSGQIQGTYGAPAGVYPGIVMEATLTNPVGSHVYSLAPYTLTVTQGGH